MKKIGCHGPVQRINLNGEDVSIHAIAVRVGALFEILGNRFYPVCVIFDRENRAEPAELLEKQLLDELNSLGYPSDQFLIACCDRMIENWILADGNCCSTHLGGIPAQPDGCHGKHVLRGAIPGRVYRETSTGAALFGSIDPAAVYKTSASFRRFVDRIAFDCDWLKGTLAPII